ncbi:MAG: DUF177 domain-containing protein [Rhodothermales bacterium]
MLSIDIAPLSLGHHTFTLHPEAEALDLEPEAFRAIEVHLELDRMEDRVWVTIDVRATATLECDRTLEPFDKEVDGTYQVYFAPPQFFGSAERAEEDDAMRLLPAGETELDLMQEVRDTLVLALPTRRISPQAEAMDVPTRFGADEEAIDPRWEALRQLRSE